MNYRLQGGPGDGEVINVVEALPFIHFVPQTTVESLFDEKATTFDSVEVHVYKRVDGVPGCQPYYEYVPEPEG